MFKRTIQILMGVFLTMQLTSCFYMGDDHRWHDGHREHHDSGINVKIHG